MTKPQTNNKTFNNSPSNPQINQQKKVFNNKNKPISKNFPNHNKIQTKQQKPYIKSPQAIKQKSFIQKNKRAKQNIQKGNNKNSKIIQDERFAKAAYDPRFLRPKKQITKVKIDNRFSKMLTDPAFQNLSKVDKYGRKINAQDQKKKRQNQQLKEFYVKQDQSQQQQQIQDQQNQIQEQQYENDQNQQMEDQNQQQEQQPANNMRKWMEQYDQESSSLADMPVQQLIQQEEKQMPEVWSDDQQNLIKNQNVKATKRLALCNYDWMNITSKDLMILFNSFKPNTGFIKSIKVYQSNFGKQRMEQQQVFGPQGIWNDQQEADQFQDQEENKSKKWRKSWKQLLRKQDSSALDSTRLRAYEKQRLKYFYAVIQCDNKKTADQIYKQCDGNQFQTSNLTFDLRFIPDDISFDKNMLKQECNQMPVAGQVKNFINRAMGHSKVQLTWQDPQLSLAASLKKKNWGKMTQQELNKIDWATYLNEQDVEQQQNKRQLFLQKDQDEVVPDWKKECNKKYRKENQGQKLVISFDSGFSSAKQNKKAAQQQMISLKKQKKSKKQLRQRAQQERKKRRQQLTLLTQGQDDQKQRNFKPNLQDQRFGAVYSNPLYSIDPSNPKFDHRRAGNVFKEVVKRNKQKNLA